MKERRFWPLFVTQFGGAFNDNFFKAALTVLIAYGLIDTGAQEPEVLITLSAGIFIFPFILFAPIGGELADKFDKARLIRALKIFEIVIVLVSIIALWLGSVYFLMALLFVFGTRSALFSPSKFSILPAHLKKNELIGGNALVNTGTYIAVLAGNIFGSILIVNALGQMSVMFLLLLCALVGYWSARQIPEAPPPAPDLTINYNTPQEAVRIMRYAYTRPRGIFTAMMGSAWFMFVSGVYLAQLSSFTSQILGANTKVLTFFLVIFSLGVALGGLFNNFLLRSKVEATFVPWAAVGIAVFSFDLFLASRGYAAAGEELLTLSEFLSQPSSWRIMFDFLCVSLCGGLYAVPLKAIVQDRTPKAHLARTVSGSALMDSLSILLSSVVAVALFSIGFEIYELFAVLGVLGLFVALYTTKLVPGFLLGK